MYNGNKTDILEQIEFAINYVVSKQTDYDKLDFFYHHEMHQGKIANMICEKFCEKMIELEDKKDNRKTEKKGNFWKSEAYKETEESIRIKKANKNEYPIFKVNFD